jgi:hypothetical protein
MNMKSWSKSYNPVEYFHITTMTNVTILRLLDKYADEAGTVLLEKSDARFKHQRHRLAEFAHQLFSRFRLILAEIEGDLVVLRERQFDPDMQKILIKVWRELEQIFKGFNQDKPYLVAQKLVEYVKSRSTRSILDNLDFLAKHHLQQTSEDISPSFQPQIRSITLLLNLAEHVEKYIAEHPLLPIVEMAPPLTGKPKVEPGPTLTPIDKTNPSVPQAKKQLV